MFLESRLPPQTAPPSLSLGLALQNTLSDVFSGIALSLGRPYVLGDWILLSDGTEGRVVESTWRSTHVLTLANNVVVLPNSVLAKLDLTNFSGLDETHGQAVTVRVAPTRMPSIILDVMRSVLLACPINAYSASSRSHRQSVRQKQSAKLQIPPSR